MKGETKMKELKEYDGMEATNTFTFVNLPIERTKALAELLTACKYLDVDVKAVSYYVRGFLVEFEGCYRFVPNRHEVSRSRAKRHSARISH